MLFTTFVVITALCLLIPFTRMYGVIGALVTAYFYPAHTLTLLGAIVLGGVVFIYWRKSHALKTTFLTHLKWSRPGTFRTKISLRPSMIRRRLMAGMHPDEFWEQFGYSLTDTSIHSLPATLPSSLLQSITDQYASGTIRRTSLVRRKADRAFGGVTEGIFNRRFTMTTANNCDP